MGFAMRFVDYHVHSNLSCDGKSTISEICEKAVGMGIQEIGFAEHMDFEPKDWGYGFFNYDKYTARIESAKELFRENLIIKKGLEVDYQYCFENKIKAWLHNKEFDFIIGSVHYIDHEIIGYESIRNNDLKRIYNLYFLEILHSLESDLFDVVGHFDLVARFLGGKKSETKKSNYSDGVATVLDKILRKKKYLEINSKGLREPYKDTNPSKRIVREFIRKGGNLISVGSDAHSTKEIGSGIKAISGFLENYNGKKINLLFE